MATLPDPYITLADAETYMGIRLPWNAMSESEKNAALQMARLYIDAFYSCISFEEDAAPDAVQAANAELANEYLKDSTALFPVQKDSTLTKKRVKAGDVESEKEFDPRLYQRTDPFPYISAIIKPQCAYMANRIDVSIVRA